MGSPVSQVAPSTQPQGKAAGTANFLNSPNSTIPGNVPNLDMSQGKGSSQTVQPTQTATTNTATSGQPQMGQPNMYPNTVGQWDNASIQPQQSRNSGGKGKG